MELFVVGMVFFAIAGLGILVLRKGMKNEKGEHLTPMA
jgi:hypothetical protein